MSAEELPVILVSATDETAANAIISELADKEGILEESQGAGERVWQLSNKYYTARVRPRALPDAAPPTPALRVEAHIIYLAEDECSAAVLDRRAAGAGAGAGVRLALCAGPAPAAELQAMARARRYELVALRGLQPEPAPEPGPFPELRGLARAREALHAHAWPGLRLAPSGSLFAGSAEDSEEDSDHSGGAGAGAGAESDDPDDEECVRRAELLADVLGAVRGVRGAGGDEVGGEERHLRAEQLLAAFCRALGHDLHSL